MSYATVEMTCYAEGRPTSLGGPPFFFKYACLGNAPWEDGPVRLALGSRIPPRVAPLA